MAMTVRDLPTVNALLNASATLLLLLGFYLIKRGREQAHKRTMLTAFMVSVLFLISYLTYHFQALHVPFTGPDAVRYVYYAILLPHVLLAATVPFLAVATIYFGPLRPAHLASPDRPLDVSHLAVRLRHGRRRVRNAVSRRMAGLCFGWPLNPVAIRASGVCFLTSCAWAGKSMLLRDEPLTPTAALPRYGTLV